MGWGRQQWLSGAVLALTIVSLLRPNPLGGRPSPATQSAHLTLAAVHSPPAAAQTSVRMAVAAPPGKSMGLASLGQFRQFPGLLTPYGVLTVTTGPVPSPAPGGRSGHGAGTPWLLRLVPWQLGSPLPSLTLSRLISRPVLATLPGRYHQAGSQGRYRLQLLGATGPWVVYVLVGVPTRGPAHSVLGTVNLANGQSRTLTTFSGVPAPSISVGSQRVLVPAGPALDLYHLTAPFQPPAVLPAADLIAARLSLQQGFQAPGLTIPGLRAVPPRAAGLVPYQSGTFILPMDAPPRWTALPPVHQGHATVVTLVNPLHPHDWIRVTWKEAAATARSSSHPLTALPSVAWLLPSHRQAQSAWLSDVTVAFRLRHAPHGYAVNGMIYPDPAGGSMEIQVSLPVRQTALATAILNSAGIPY